MNKKSLLHTAGGAVSALALAAAMSPAHAFDFQVGDNTKATIGGYIKLDVIGTPDENDADTIAISAIDTGDANDDEAEGKTRLHARQSRLWVLTRTSVGGSDLFTRLETDFFGSRGDETVTNSHLLRMRHAYGEWNGILAGQTWSNFMPLVALPATLDFGGPAGYIFNRQAQLRYTVPAGPGKFSIALENPEAAVEQLVDERDDDGVLTGRRVAGGQSINNDPLPDFTAQYQGNIGIAKFALSGVVNQLEIDDGSDDESELGWGVMAAGSASLPTGTTIGGNAGWFDGSNRYCFGCASRFKNGIYNGSDIETFGELALLAYADQALTPQLNSLVSVGYSNLLDIDEEDEVDAAAANFMQRTLSVHANLRFKPIDRVMYGIEYQYAKVWDLEGEDGDNNRIQFSAQYFF